MAKEPKTAPPPDQRIGGKLTGGKPTKTVAANAQKSQPRSQPQRGLGPGRGRHWPLLPPYRLAMPLALVFQLQQSEWWEPERLLDHQLQQVHRLIKHAAATVPYYRERLAELAALPEGALTKEKFRTIPVMDGSDVRAAGDEMFSRDVPINHGDIGWVKSSGSTGFPIEIATTQLAAIFGMALTVRGHLWHRRDFTEDNVDIRTAFKEGEEPKNPRFVALPESGRAFRFDINLPVNTLFDMLIEQDPGYLQTHPYTLLGLVERSVELGVKPKRLKEARTFGEELSQRIRDEVKEHWGIPVSQNYSAMEIGLMAQQCPDNTNLHVQSENVLLEVLNEDGSETTPGNVGRVTLTPLQNFAAPLIRYDIGDYAEVGSRCSCGRGLPVLKKIMGRHRNLAILPNGDRFFPEIRPEMKKFLMPRKMQIIQRNFEELDVKLALDEPLDSAMEKKIVNCFHKVMRHPFHINIQEVDDIPRAANGKFEEFKCEVARPQAESEG